MGETGGREEDKAGNGRKEGKVRGERGKKGIWHYIWLGVHFQTYTLSEDWEKVARLLLDRFGEGIDLRLIQPTFLTPHQQSIVFASGTQ